MHDCPACTFVSPTARRVIRHDDDHRAPRRFVRAKGSTGVPAGHSFCLRRRCAGKGERHTFLVSCVGCRCSICTHGGMRTTFSRLVGKNTGLASPGM